MKKLFSKELIIGLTVMLALLILFFGIEYLKGVNIFHDSNYYYATYTNVEGLSVSAPVTVNGYKVGQVKDIQYQYNNPGHVLVELSLNNDLKVPQGSKAILASDLLGTASIVLELAPNTNFHSAGDQLIGENAKGLMENVTNDILPGINPIMGRVDSLLIATTMIATDPALISAIQHLNNVMAQLETSTSQLSSLMGSLPPIVGSASSTMTNVNTLSADLLKISKDLQVVSKELTTLPIDSTFNNINSITRNVDDLTHQLNDPNSSLGLLMRDPSLYNNLNRSASHVDSILIDLQRQPKRYIPSIKLF